MSFGWCSNAQSCFCFHCLWHPLKIKVFDIIEWKCLHYDLTLPAFLPPLLLIDCHFEWKSQFIYLFIASSRRKLFFCTKSVWHNFHTVLQSTKNIFLTKIHSLLNFLSAPLELQISIERKTFPSSGDLYDYGRSNKFHITKSSEDISLFLQDYSFHLTYPGHSMSS